MNGIKLLQKLIQIPSFSGQEEKLSEFIMKYCQNFNIPAQLFNRNIVIHLRGKDHTKALIFNAHMDTVAVGNNIWKYPAVGKKAGQIIGGKIFGLGASDDKAAIAVMLILAKLQDIPPCDIWITFVCNEETDGSGTAAFIKEFTQSKYFHTYKKTAAIIGEPTNLNCIEVGHRGNVFVQLETSGISGHGALKYKTNETAVEKMFLIIFKLKKVFKIWKKKYKHEILGKPNFNITNITSMSGSMNKISDRCQVILDIRTTPFFHEKLESLLQKTFGNHVCTTKILGSSLPGVISSKSHIIKTMKNIIPNIQTSVSVGSTDLSQFLRIGIDAVVFGPGRKEVIHKNNEYADISNLEKALIIYNKVISAFAELEDYY